MESNVTLLIIVLYTKKIYLKISNKFFFFRNASLVMAAWDYQPVARLTRRTRVATVAVEDLLLGTAVIAVLTDPQQQCITNLFNQISNRPTFLHRFIIQLKVRPNNR